MYNYLFKNTVLLLLIFTILSYGQFSDLANIKEKPYIPDYKNFVMSAKTDLNKDGIKEDISIKEISSTVTTQNNFILTVNNLSIKGQIDGSIDGFDIIDINTKDRFKEIAVHTPGESDDDDYIIYRYDGHTIESVGHIFRWPQFYGNGIVLVDNWMGFWTKKEKYVLNNKTGKLTLVPQSFYNVGVKAKVSKSFPIYRTTSMKHVVANLREGSEIEIVLCDPYIAKVDENGYRNEADFFYLIRSSSGLMGWVKGELLMKSEFVEGLLYAD